MTRGLSQNITENFPQQAVVTEYTRPRETPSRLLIVDDHPILRLGIRALLSREPDLQVVGECSDARAAIECLRQLQPDAVIVDITLSGGTDGLELIKNMLAEQPRVNILVLSAHDENLYALRALSAGARGYLMKETSAEVLKRAIHALLAGQITVSPHLTQRLVQQAVDGRGGVAPSDSLSDRELEVLLRIGRGQSSGEVAAALGIAVKTVETHRANMRRKLLVRSGAELLRYAVAWSHAQGLKGCDKTEGKVVNPPDEGA